MYSELEADGRFMLKLFVWTRRLIYKRGWIRASRLCFFSDILPVNYYKSLLSTKKTTMPYMLTARLTAKETACDGNRCEYEVHKALKE